MASPWAEIGLEEASREGSTSCPGFAALALSLATISTVFRMKSKMRTPKKPKQAAIEALADHFSATLKKIPGRSSTLSALIEGRRITIDIVCIPRRSKSQRMLAKPHLRFDKVALELICDLQASLSPLVPPEQVLVITVTAPIRLGSRTTAALDGMVRKRLSTPNPRLNMRETIFDNQVRARLIRGASKHMSRLIVFVHNPETDPETLLGLTESLIKRVGLAAGKRPSAKFKGERWLVLANADGASLIVAYRYICAQLLAAAGFSRILMSVADGEVETLITHS